MHNTGTKHAEVFAMGGGQIYLKIPKNPSKKPVALRTSSTPPIRSNVRILFASVL